MSPLQDTALLDDAFVLLDYQTDGVILPQRTQTVIVMTVAPRLQTS